MPFDPAVFRHTMRLWATGVTVVGSAYNGELNGMTVSSFTSVTLEPPLVLICIQKTAETAETILQSRAFSVSMLGEGQEDISNLFAGYVPLAEGENRFNRVKVCYAETGSPIIADAMGWLDCQLHAVQDGSTHHIFIGEVVAASDEPEHPIAPLIYYHRNYRKIEPIQP
jgi:flavin reductase (DIM6/NTAB) family NADH-FMN oxidoreductase RutF